MGGCSSSEKAGAGSGAGGGVVGYLGKGEIPRKIVKTKNPDIFIPQIVYLFGGSKILMFDTREKKISNLPVHPTCVLPKRTQCEYLTDLNKIATLGGTVDKKPTTIGYLFDPQNWSNELKLPDFPVPIRYTTLAYVDDYLYAIGGETEGNVIIKDVYRLQFVPELGTAWEKFAQLPKERRSANVMVANGIIHVFGGVSNEGLRSTQIDTINTKTKACSQLEVRLPLGVEGARMCWHGDDLLLIGGIREGSKPDPNVLLLDFEKKAIMSMRDLAIPRKYPLVIPVAIDEVVVIGGADTKQATIRRWNEKLADYQFENIVVEGQELLEAMDCYDSALPTFLDVVTDRDHFPEISTESRLIFGNEIDCFLIEVTKDKIANFYKSPMKLQQKSGQTSLKTDANTIYLVGGTDYTRTKISSKTYRFLIKSKEVTELGKLELARYFPTVVNEGNLLFAIGGKIKGGQATETVEMLDLGAAPGQQKWQTIAPMKHKRFGHISWVGKGKIYVMGGTSHDKGKPIDEIEIYDIASKTWSVHPSLKMAPALSGANCYYIDEWVYIFGGQDSNDRPTNLISKIQRCDPTSIQVAGYMKVPRVDPFAFDLCHKIVVMGGSDQPLIEVFDEKTLAPEPGMENKSASFFYQLACYTSDSKLENSSVG